MGFAGGVIDGGHQTAGRLLVAEPVVGASVPEQHQAFFSIAVEGDIFALLTQTRFWGLTKNRDVVKNVRLVERE